MAENRRSMPTMPGKLLMLPLFLLVALVIGCSNDDHLFVVDTNGDGNDTLLGDNRCQTSSGHCTLRAAIEEINAQPEDRSITWRVELQATGQYEIDHDLISQTYEDGFRTGLYNGLQLFGDRVVRVYGNSDRPPIRINVNDANGRIFTIQKAKLTLVNVMLAEGYAGERFSTANPDIQGWVGRFAPRRGGAIAMDKGAILELVSSELFANRAVGNGGAIARAEINNWNYSGPVFSYPREVPGDFFIDVVDTVFTANSATSGGAMYLEGGGLLVQSGLFFNNEASYRGGALDLFNWRNDVLIGNAIFRQNRAGIGGAVHTNYLSTSPTIRIFNSEFYANRALRNAAAIDGNPDATETGPLGFGAAIFAGNHIRYSQARSPINIFHSTFYMNFAENDYAVVNRNHHRIGFYNSVFARNYRLPPGATSVRDTGAVYSNCYGKIELLNTLASLQQHERCDLRPSVANQQNLPDTEPDPYRGFASIMDINDVESLAGLVPAAGSAVIDYAYQCIQEWRSPVGFEEMFYHRDRRGMPRPQDGDDVDGTRCDAGAVEFNASG